MLAICKNGEDKIMWAVKVAYFSDLDKAYADVHQAIEDSCGNNCRALQSLGLRDRNCGVPNYQPYISDIVFRLLIARGHYLVMHPDVGGVYHRFEY